MQYWGTSGVSGIWGELYPITMQLLSIVTVCESFSLLVVLYGAGTAEVGPPGADLLLNVDEQRSVFA